MHPFGKRIFKGTERIIDGLFSDIGPVVRKLFYRPWLRGNVSGNVPGLLGAELRRFPGDAKRHVVFNKSGQLRKPVQTCTHVEAMLTPQGWKDITRGIRQVNPLSICTVAPRTIRL